MYIPHPKDTALIDLNEELGDLIETLAENVHENWAMRRLKEGWEYGIERDDTLKKHPCLVPYEQLSETEKEYDRKTVTETLKMVILCGYRIIRENQINETQ